MGERQLILENMNQPLCDWYNCTLTSDPRVVHVFRETQNGTKVVEFTK